VNRLPVEAFLLPPALGWMGMIFYLSSRVQSAVRLRSRLPDYVTHSGEYFILALLYLLALHNFLPPGRAHPFWTTLGWCFVYAAADELHQHYVPTRDASFRDLGADMVGVSGAVPVFAGPVPGGEEGATALSPAG
jgi:VanZ family protein